MAKKVDPEAFEEREGQCGQCERWFPREELASMNLKIWPSEAFKKKHGWSQKPEQFRLRLCPSCLREEKSELKDMEWNQRVHERPVPASRN